MINKKICFSNRYIDLINRLFKTIMYNILYIYLVYSFYEDNNRILVILVCAREKSDVAKSVKKYLNTIIL